MKPTVYLIQSNIIYMLYTTLKLINLPHQSSFPTQLSSNLGEARPRPLDTFVVLSTPTPFFFLKTFLTLILIKRVKILIIPFEFVSSTCSRAKNL